MSWHITGPLLAAYLDDAIDAVDAASVEQHLLACGPCRATLAAASPLPAGEFEGIWSGIREAIEAPAPTFIERLAVRLGVSASEARLLAVAPSLRTSWFAGLAIAVGLALLAARLGDEHAIALFLLVAPLAPLAGVALVFGPLADPAHEVVSAAPYPGFRLLLLRAAAVLVTSIPMVALAASLLPVPTWVAIGWLLPALAFALGALALSSRIQLEHAATAIGLAWAVAIAGAAADRSVTSVLSPELQPIYLTLALIAIAVLVVRSRGSAPPIWRNP